MSRKRTFSLALSAVSLIAFLLSGGVAEAKRGPSSVTVCVDSKTSVVSQVSTSAKCTDEIQKWSASKLAPQLCWDASSVDPKSKTRLVSIKPPTGCVAPLRSVPVGKVVLLCADQVSGVLRWSVTNACEVGNGNTWVRVGALRNAASATTTTTSVALVPSVSLAPTLIRGNTWPKAVTVTANVAGTVYFVEGNSVVNSVSDITSLSPMRWATGKVSKPDVPTSLALNVDDLLNGYFRVYLVDAQGVLSAPAANIVTISITRAYENSAIVRNQTLDQNAPTWHVSNFNAGVMSTQSVGQSFTAGLSGPLSRVSLGLTRSGTVTQITAEIYASDSSGNATGAALASKTIVGTTLPTSPGGSLTNFDFASPVSVVAGTKYVIVLTTPDQSSMGGGGSYRLYSENGNSYIGGNGIVHPLTTQNAQNDYVFQTYVDV